MALFGRKKGEGSRDGTRLFFATDVHGSDRCFRKFLNAGRFYGVQHLILGGDITGKTIVPIERTPRGWTAQYLDRFYADMTESERRDLERLIRDEGGYPVAGERDELEALADEAHREQFFIRVVVDNIRRWVELAEERLRGTGIRCFVTPGNDDFFEIDEALKGSDVVEFVEGCCIRLDETHEMITTGFSNITPWDSPRELPEDDLAARIEAMFRDVEDPANLIAVLHPPPYGSGLDEAPAIGDDFRPRMGAAGMVMASVGSTAVREFIERRQPLIGLHGHVHESRGVTSLGRTLCLNPGSEYTDGTLCGAIVTLGEGRVLAQQLVTG